MFEKYDKNPPKRKRKTAEKLGQNTQISKGIPTLCILVSSKAGGIKMEISQLFIQISR